MTRIPTLHRGQTRRRPLARAILGAALAAPIFGTALPAVAAEPMTRESASKLAESLELDTIKLISAGAGDKQVVTLTPVTEAERVFTTRQKMDMQMSMGGMQMPAQVVPATVITMRSQVAEVMDDGSFKVKSTIESASAENAPGVNPMMAQSLEASLAEMVGTTTTMHMMPNGSMGDTTVEGDNEAVNQQVRDMMPASAAEMPSEAIAPGAIWQRKTTMEQNGMSIIMVATSTLIAVSDASFEVATDFAMIFNEQKLEGDMLPPGADVTVSDGFGTGRSIVVMDRRTAMPISGKNNSDVSMTLSMDMGGQMQDLGQTIKMTMTYSSPEG